MNDSPESRPATLAEFRAALEQLVKTTRPSTFSAEPVHIAAAVVPPAPQPPAASPFHSSVGAPHDVPPPGATCPQCHTAIRAIADRNCPQCGRPYYEPCLNCQSLNPFWVRNCRGCNSDLLALKQQMFANLNAQKQQILKYRDSYGHDKTPPLLKYMSTVNHPDFAAFKEWAKSMTMLIQKERRDIKAYVEGIKAQANAAMQSQKYERVRQILEQVPRPLLDEPLRQQYVDAGDALTEVDSLIKEIRNAISTKQYSQLLSCVQRYAELKANDPEAQNLQRKIEKLTTMTSSKGIKLRRIPGGRFYMGSHDSDEYLRNNEHPQHKVVIGQNLFIGVYPVTQKQFQELMEYNPSMITDNEECPVEWVTWFSAVEFCNKMSEVESLQPYYAMKAIRRRSNGAIEGAKVTILGGDGFRLPTEAEWEYACRAGSISPWCFGDQVLDVGIYAWYYDNSTMETHPVGQRKPNSWGLYDMHGNVMEWCYDWYNEFQYQQCGEEEENPTGPEDGAAKVLRGGAWQFGAEATRCAYRNSSAPEAIAGVIGFRICRNASDDAM
jgi:formylglycine-generating enzyme required for sulfatase activity/ribosomal protein L40E